MVLNRFYVPRFGDLERDYARRENEQFAAFAATTQLLAKYSCRKENQRMLYACTVVVKTDSLSDTERKVVTRFP